MKTWKLAVLSLLAGVVGMALALAIYVVGAIAYRDHQDVQAMKAFLLQVQQQAAQRQAAPAK